MNFLMSYQQVDDDEVVTIFHALFPNLSRFE